MDLQELGTGAKTATDSRLDRIEKAYAEKARRQREYRLQNRDRIREIEKRSKAKRKEADAAYRRQWRLDTLDRDNENQRLWRERNRAKLRNSYRSYYAAKRERRLAQSKASRERHSAEIKTRRKLDRANRKVVLNAKWNDYYARNPDKLKEKHRKYLPKRLALRKLLRATNPAERIKDACRTRVRFILSQAGVTKNDRTFSLVGCTPDFLKSFLEAQFNPMMNWDNYGTYWEIDHIIALSKFDLENKEQLFKAFHYSNCRPLEVPSNRSKCANGIGIHQPLLL